MANYEQIVRLNKLLLEDMPEMKSQSRMFPSEEDAQRQLLRSLMNIRPALPLRKEFLDDQDQLLQRELSQKRVTDCAEIPASIHRNIKLWRGDITTLKVDAIVNAANQALLGCFVPCHNCIDNAIHSASGLQLREECAQIMERQGHPEGTGTAKLTAAYNLPSKHVIHTVGPIIHDRVTPQDCDLLASCYVSCLRIAIENELASIAFCCISTGEFRFPHQLAAEIAVHTVSEYLEKTSSEIEVIFNVFKAEDEQIYKQLLR